MPFHERDKFARPDPEALLKHVQAAERSAVRGPLKIFLGYASGVGKSFRMFDEGRRRRERGEDVVIAAMQPNMDPDVEQIVRTLDVIPTLTSAGVPVIDVAAVLARRPQVCLVDGLAYDNPPGSRHPKRYQDVDELLAAGIAVATSINIEYIDEQQDFVEGVTGRRRRETVPLAFIDQAEEVVVVDAPPEAETTEQAERLSKLRQRALLLTADVVDQQLEAYLQLHGIQPTWGTQERILVCMTPRANAAAMLASGRRNADRFHGELFAIYVNQPHLTAEDRSALARNVMLARAQDAHIDVLDSNDPIGAILAYARSHGITQLFVGHNLRRGMLARFTGTLLDRLIDGAGGIDVRVFPPLMAADATPSRGRLKVFLGYAAGVGKTYQMLSEAQQMKKSGIDVVIGYFEPHARKDTMALTEGLEAIPRRIVEYRGARLEEMDTDAILHRRPRVAVVDEFPHSNVPGSDRPKRWEDVQVLLDAGIDVLTTMNVQHLESLNDQIWQSTGVRVRETIPDWLLRQADEVVMVDLTPSALLNRLKRGVVYPPDRAKAALENFFRHPTLAALRELAMRQTAHAAESRHPQDEPAEHDDRRTMLEARERLLLLIEPIPASAALIRRARRVADYVQADCLAVYVAKDPTMSDLAPEARDTVERQLNFARGLQIETRILEGADVADTLVNFARTNGVTQIFVMRQSDDGLTSFLRRGLVQRIVGLAADMQVTIVADRSSQRPIK